MIETLNARVYYNDKKILIPIFSDYCHPATGTLHP